VNASRSNSIVYTRPAQAEILANLSEAERDQLLPEVRRNLSRSNTISLLAPLGFLLGPFLGATVFFEGYLFFAIGLFGFFFAIGIIGFISSRSLENRAKSIFCQTDYARQHHIYPKELSGIYWDPEQVHALSEQD